ADLLNLYTFPTRRSSDLEAQKQGIKTVPEVMIPLVGDVKELVLEKEIVNKTAEEVFKRKGVRVDYLVGTMIELPAAALSAGEIRSEEHTSELQSRFDIVC